ncbi:hypothetical protein PVAP13_3NG150501 [Panicum virgatum]|uniref:Uncharacterized protein n=1 Tax=Panicum virgatum TaxID=38727 RepID=A0A8T0UCV2_PANVG|nr:hypothetical protein PVAP13_3NG150501 [Panicum virgatum]
MTREERRERKTERGGCGRQSPVEEVGGGPEKRSPGQLGQAHPRQTGRPVARRNAPPPPPTGKRAAATWRRGRRGSRRRGGDVRTGRSGSRREGGATAADPAGQCAAVPVGRRRRAKKSAGVGDAVRQIPAAADPGEDDPQQQIPGRMTPDAPMKKQGRGEATDDASKVSSIMICCCLTTTAADQIDLPRHLEDRQIEDLPWRGWRARPPVIDISPGRRGASRSSRGRAGCAS